MLLSIVRGHRFNPEQLFLHLQSLWKRNPNPPYVPPNGGAKAPNLPKQQVNLRILTQETSPVSPGIVRHYRHSTSLIFLSVGHNRKFKLFRGKIKHHSQLCWPPLKTIWDSKMGEISVK